MARPITLVIADDSEDARRLASLLFGGLPDFEVQGEAADAATAADLVERHQPDVVLLDHSMPTMTGPEAIDDLRRRSPGTAIVMVSGYAKADLEVRWLAGRLDDYVEKGVSTAHLVGAVRRAAARGPTRREDPGRSGALVPPSGAGEAPRRPPSLADIVVALHDGPVQALSGALWTLDALGEVFDDEARRQELLAQLRTGLRSALQATRAISRWAHGDGDA